MRLPAPLADLRTVRVPVGTIVRLLVSLALALVLWGWVTTQQDPTISKSFTAVPIQAQLPEPLIIAGNTQLGDVSLRVAGPLSLVQSIDAASLSPHLDLKGIDKPGSYTVPVVVNVPDAVRIEQQTPTQMPIVVDDATSKSFHLDYEVQPLQDTTRRVGEITPQVSEVTVSGSRRLVDQVVRVVLPIEIGDHTSTFNGQFTPQARDANGEPIPEVDIRPRRVDATVAVEARGKSVPVLIQTIGNPAEGYDVIDRVVNPSMVLLDGPDGVLNDLVSVSTEPVSIEGARQPVSARVGLTGLPAGVRVVDPADGKVTVVIQFRQRGVTQTLSDQQVVVTDVPPGLDATVEPATISIVVFAAEQTLGDLRASDIAARVSVAGLTAGSYDLRPTVALPPDVQWLRTDPETVRVTLRPTAGPAPVSTKAPSPPALGSATPRATEPPRTAPPPTPTARPGTPAAGRPPANG